MVRAECRRDLWGALIKFGPNHEYILTDFSSWRIAGTRRKRGKGVMKVSWISAHRKQSEIRNTLSYFSVLDPCSEEIY